VCGKGEESIYASVLRDLAHDFKAMLDLELPSINPTDTDNTRRRARALQTIWDYPVVQAQHCTLRYLLRRRPGEVWYVVSILLCSHHCIKDHQRHLPVVLQLVFEPGQLFYDFLALLLHLWICHCPSGPMDIIDPLCLKQKKSVKPQRKKNPFCNLLRTMMTGHRSRAET
jgi:hypothetical protein